jgi:type I restriction enzyme M protein
MRRSIPAALPLCWTVKGSAPRGTTKAVWVWDMRAGQPAYGKTRPLRVEDFAKFEAAYGAEPNGTAKREDQGAEGRWRRFTRAEIAARSDNLDISWLRASDEAAEDSLEEPEDILDAIRVHLAKAMAEIEGLAGELEMLPPGEAAA